MEKNEEAIPAAELSAAGTASSHFDFFGSTLVPCSIGEWHIGHAREPA
jgi:hypothetical protein